MTEVDAPKWGGRLEAKKKVDVNHPEFFDRYSRLIKQ